MLTRIIKTYSEEILKRYDEKGVLLEPTRTDIKDMCIARFLEENPPRDEEILRLFFRANQKDDLLKIIENTDPEKFRTVQNFLLRNTGSTSKKNLNLIAWLIDFQPRPYSAYRTHNVVVKKIDEKQHLPKNEKVIIPESETFTTVKIPEEVGPPKKPINFWLKVASVVILFCTVLFFGINYMIQESKTNTEKISVQDEHLTDTEECMAWDGTAYQLADCTDSIHPTYKTKVIAYDKSLQKNLKKVDVSIKTKFFAPNNKTPLIWYYKVGKNEFEYYTSHGIHPINGEPLEDITQYHIDTHIPKHKIAKDSYLEED